MSRWFMLPVCLAVAVCGVVGVPAASAAEAGAPCSLKSTDGTIARSADGRAYLVHVPSGLPAARVPLLISLHGLGGSAQGQENQTGWSAFADAHGFIVAYPQGSSKPMSEGGPWQEQSGSDDVKYLNSVVDGISARWCVDHLRVYADGYSRGGYMSQRLACDSAGRFAAVVEYAGGSPNEMGGPCNPSRPVSVGLFHGEGDWTVPLEAGLQSRDEWVSRNRCRSEADAEPVDEGTLLRYRGCAGGVEVMWRTYPGQPHFWPWFYRADEMRERMWAFLTASRISEQPSVPEQTAAPPQPPAPAGAEPPPEQPADSPPAGGEPSAAPPGGAPPPREPAPTEPAPPPTEPAPAPTEPAPAPTEPAPAPTEPAPPPTEPAPAPTEPAPAPTEPAPPPTEPTPPPTESAPPPTESAPPPTESAPPPTEPAPAPTEPAPAPTEPAPAPAPEWSSSRVTPPASQPPPAEPEDASQQPAAGQSPPQQERDAPSAPGSEPAPASEPSAAPPSRLITPPESQTGESYAARGPEDAEPPLTSFDRVPRPTIRRRHTVIRFSSSEPGGSFACRLDARRWRRCGSPVLLGHLRPGAHEFKVVAVDREGNRDQTPEVARFRVALRRPG